MLTKLYYNNLHNDWTQSTKTKIEELQHGRRKCDSLTDPHM